MDDKLDIATDKLRGAKAISKFIGESERRTRYLLDKGVLTHGREGKAIIASKARLRADYERVTAGSNE